MDKTNYITNDIEALLHNTENDFNSLFRISNRIDFKLYVIFYAKRLAKFVKIGHK